MFLKLPWKYDQYTDKQSLELTTIDVLIVFVAEAKPCRKRVAGWCNDFCVGWWTPRGLYPPAFYPKIFVVVWNTPL